MYFIKLWSPWGTSANYAICFIKLPFFKLETKNRICAMNYVVWINQMSNIEYHTLFSVLTRMLPLFIAYALYIIMPM